MTESPVGSTNAVRADLEALRTLREPREARRDDGDRGAASRFARLARWGLALFPLSLLGIWHLLLLPGYTGFGLVTSCLQLFGIVGLLWIVGRAPGVKERGSRDEGLVQVGLSTGVLVVSLLPALMILFMLLFVLAAIVVQPSGARQLISFELPPLSALLYGHGAALPLGLSLVCRADVRSGLRRVRTSPLGWRDCTWLLLGLLSAAPTAWIALLDYQFLLA